MYWHFNLNEKFREILYLYLLGNTLKTMAILLPSLSTPKGTRLFFTKSTFIIQQFVGV